MSGLGSKSIARAIAESRNRSEDWTAYCLRFVRTCLGVDPRERSAKDAWAAVKPSERHTSWPPPPGVPVFWAGGTWGHVALSAGGGFCWSNDVLRRGHIDKVRISTINRRWGFEYLGWTERLNGVRVYVKPTVPPTVPVVDLAKVAAAFRADPKAAQGKGLHPAHVRPVEAALIQVGLLDDRWGRDGAAGTKTVRAYARWQRRQGYSGPASDGIPGSVSLRKLARETKLFTVKET